ncbi:hypothetical protein C7H19_15675 [Aphanothece hegewaldii CCALA 016]|uniref:Uncharacterized protein n=1 Tax=Aphanothece hegewaldii CCALA 016 TaxID=2107694 RepID=A0A2T1LVC9_9CHRO|nr:hypothetical protein [Aphanothece hegewaldii]PSF35676.1 hypothetical protein C7H19_15675 [Aphanothece hegewaldii CCALA 016]
MLKKIKLMPDYQCFPLWDMEEPDNIDPKDLPLKKALIDDLYKWAESFDAVLNWTDPTLSGFKNEQDAEAFETEGIRLWLLLREQLKPNYAVYYKSYKLHKLISDPSQLQEALRI